MADYRIASRYAKSLIDLAIERNELETIKNDFSALLEGLNGNKELQNFFKSPIIGGDVKQKTIKAIYGNTFSDTSLAFINIIIHKRRETYLREIAEYVVKLYDQHEGIVKAELYVASAINPTLEKEILMMVKKQIGQDIKMSVHLKPELIGGYLLKIGDKQIDASLAKQIKRLKDQFDDNLYLKAY